MLATALRDTMTFYRQHWFALAVIILPFVVPTEVLSMLYRESTASETGNVFTVALPILVSMLIYSVYSIAVVFYIASRIKGDHPGTVTLWRLGLRFWLPYTLLSFCVTGVVMLGFFMLIVPGLVFATRYAFAEFDLLLNQHQPLTAMKQSWDLSRDYFWLIFGGFAVITLVLYGPFYLVMSGLPESGLAYTTLDTASTVVYPVLNALYTVYAFRIYDMARAQQPPTQRQNSEQQV